jgi:hypothetical protein
MTGKATRVEKRYGFGYKMTTTTTEDGKSLPVSTGEVGGPDHNYVTVPWNYREEDPGDPGNPVSLSNGWTFLYGPTLAAEVSAFIRLQRVQEGCSTHLRLYVSETVNGVDTRVTSLPFESPERFVGPGETHVGPDGTVTYSSTHLDGSWHVPPLRAGQRLRLEVDYWNATEEPYLVGKIVGARVGGTYWRDVS